MAQTSATPAIAGYDLGSSRVPRSPVSLEQLRQLGLGAMHAHVHDAILVHFLD